MTNLQRNTLRCAAAAVVLCLGLARLAASQTINPPTPDPVNDLSANIRLKVFQHAIQYPPESRPLSASQWDLLHPWTVDTPTLPLTPASWEQQVNSLVTSGAPHEEVASKFALASSFPVYNFAVNKLMLAGTEDELVAILTVSPPQGSTTVPPFHVTKARLIGDANFGSPDAGSVPFYCETGANPVCTFRWRAPAAEKRYWGAMKLQVTGSLEGKGDDYVAMLHFYSSPIVAGEFTGDFQERLVDGSLLIDVGVSVEKRMACSVSANLFSVDKEVPTHHFDRRMIVDPSMKTITFTFFGKIFRDNAHEETFRLQDLKAQCENVPYPPEWITDTASHLADLEGLWNSPHVPTEPTRIYFEYNDFTYTTQSYLNNAFSDKVWQYPEATRKKLALLEKSAQQQDEAGEARRRDLKLAPSKLQLP